MTAVSGMLTAAERAHALLRSPSTSGSAPRARSRWLLWRVIVVVVGMGLAVAPVPDVATAAPALPYRPAEVVVRYKRSARAQSATMASLDRGAGPLIRVIHLPRRASMERTIRRLRRRGDVEYAVPNYLARAADVVPNDPGRGTTGRQCNGTYRPPFMDLP